MKTEAFEKILKKHSLPDYGPGYSVSIELDGKSILKNYAGYANLDYDIPIHSETVFDVGSLAKQFTACCIAILVCEKRIHLYDSVRVYLPEMKEYAEQITIRHLLFMTAGFEEQLWLKHYISCSPLSGMELFYRQNEPYYDPGDYSIYSNTCYSLLGDIVESVTGMTEHEFAKQRIFDPLGMVHSHIHQDADIIIKNCATAYKQIEDNSFKLFDARHYPTKGDGGLYTTAEDLVLWHNCLMNKNLPAAPSKLFDLLFSRFTLNSGELALYGFGFFYDKDNHDIIFQHGDYSGWQCVMRLYLKKKLSIIVLSNLRQAKPVELALELENHIIQSVFSLPEQKHYLSEYYKVKNEMNYMANTQKTRKVEHLKFPHAVKQNPLTDHNRDKYLGRYYCYELDTYFDIVSSDDGIDMKYADKDGADFTHLLDFSNQNQITARTHGDWGGDVLPIIFYGDEHKTDFFVLQNGVGHFMFNKLSPAFESGYSAIHGALAKNRCFRFRQPIID